MIDDDDSDWADPEFFEVNCEECGGSYDSRTGYGCACKRG